MEARAPRAQEPVQLAAQLRRLDFLRVAPGHGAHRVRIGNAGLEEVHRVVELQPDSPEAHANLGITLLRQRKLEEAETSLRAALERRPAYPLALNSLGNTLAEQGRLIILRKGKPVDPRDFRGVYRLTAPRQD